MALLMFHSILLLIVIDTYKKKHLNVKVYVGHLEAQLSHLTCLVQGRD